MVWFPFRFSLPLSTSTWNLSCLRLCVWTDRRVVGSRSRPVTRSLLSIFHGPVTLRVQTQAACSLWYTLKPEGVSIAHIKLLHSVIYRVSLWAPSVSLHYRGMRADSPASPPSHTHTHVQTCWIWCHECEFWSNEIIPVALLFVTDWPGAEIQRVFKAQLMVCKVMAFNVISGLTEWAIKETWSLWSFPLPAVFTLFTPNTRRNLVLPLGNNMIPPSRFVTLCSALSLPIPPSSHCQLPSLNVAAFIHVFIQSFMLTDGEINTSHELWMLYHLHTLQQQRQHPPASYTFVFLLFCFFPPSSPDAIAPRRMGDTVITDVIRRTLYSPRQQKTRLPMWLLPQG